MGGDGGGNVLSCCGLCTGSSSTRSAAGATNAERAFQSELEDKVTAAAGGASSSTAANCPPRVLCSAYCIGVPVSGGGVIVCAPLDRGRLKKASTKLGMERALTAAAPGAKIVSLV